MDTLLLDQHVWDLVLDLNNNVAVAAKPYSEAQDVASAVRLQLGELWYDKTLGVPYLNNVILGNKPSLQFIRTKIEEQALTVPNIAQARCLFASFEDRVLTGQVQVIDVDGVSNNINF